MIVNSGSLYLGEIIDLQNTVLVSVSEYLATN